MGCIVRTTNKIDHMVKYVYVIALAFIAFTGRGQSQIDLDSCLNQAYRNFEFGQQADFTAQITEANIAAVNKNYLPSLDLNAVATYQNEQISIPVQVPIPGFEAPVAPLNINNALLSLRQWIYDGSMTRNQRLIQEASGNVSLKEIEVQKLDLKNKVMQLYFSVLLQEKQLEILEQKAEVLKERLNEVGVAVESNLLLKSDESMLKAEIVKLKQSITKVHYGRLAGIVGLEQLMGISIPEEVELIEPAAQITSITDPGMRPDVQLLSSQINLLEAQKGMIKSNYLPRIGVFADGGLGLPGYDIFRDEVAPMAKVGVSMQWHIFDWNRGSVQRQTLDLSQNLMRLKQDRLKRQIGVQSGTEQQNMEKARRLMQDDQEMLDLYKSVSAAYASQLENGMITSAEYIQQLNLEQEARTNLELHKLQLLIATMNYNTLLEGK
jgi:outer membrane protein TolC